jgi:DNA-binding beta-propeller fold protein YncE
MLANPPATGLLLIPDSAGERIMAFDAVSGALLDADYIPADPDRLRTPIEVLVSPDGESLLVADQIEDVVRQYDREGNSMGIFAPAGGVDNAILDNIRGIAFAANGNLLVSVASGANHDTVAEFDAGGNYLGNRVPSGGGGLASPFDIHLAGSDLLVSGADSDAIHRYDASGTFLGIFASIDGFPEQIAPSLSGGYLIANHEGSEMGIVELDASGGKIGHYAPAGLSDYRGVFELSDNTLLVSTSSGVYRIDRGGNLLETLITGVSGRFISFLATPQGGEPPPVTSEPTPVPLFSGWALWLLVGLVGWGARRRLPV